MQFPLSFWDIGLWLAITAMILLATSEFISPCYGYANFLVEKKRLRRAALVVGLLFLATVFIRIYGMVSTP